METALGTDFGAVRVHVGAHVPAVGAVAYAQGTDLHFAPGAYDPTSQRGQELIGHELAHVVQQSEGRAQANAQAKGLGVREDADLEREADDWGARAARGEAIARPAGAVAALAGRGGAIQRAQLHSHWGDFVDAGYHKTSDGDGVEIDLSFSPGPDVDATKIGMVQSLVNRKHGVPSIMDPTENARMVPGTGDKIDRRMDRTNPVYGSSNTEECKLEDTKETNAPAGEAPDKTNATYQLGHRHHEGGAEQIKEAWMHDEAESDRSPDSGMEFETTALAIAGAQQGTYYGSVRWGFRVDTKGKLTRIDPTLVSAGVPSQHFLGAAVQWNGATARGTVAVSVDDAPLYDAASMRPTAKLAKDTEVQVTAVGASAGIAMSRIRVSTGPHTGMVGYVKATELADRGDGRPTTDLPIPDVHVLHEAHELNADVPGPWREFRTLAPGTRVLLTGNRPGPADPGQVWIRVVDGPDTGAEGYVTRTKLLREHR